MDARQIPLTGGWIDRDAATRGSEEALDHAWRDPRATVLRLRGAKVPVSGVGASRKLALVPTAECEARPDARLFLGRRDGAPVFAVAEPDGGDGGAGEWFHPFDVALDLGHDERELVVIASALARWHESAGVSSRDGEPTRVADGGWSRRDARGAELFPRTDPAVIVLVEHADRVLLGSNALWETGRFSLLAGFDEAGESLEQAVAREIFEESGMRLGEIRYIGSQPWPFPRSLMLGFHARLADGQDPEALVPDPQEISELRWFSRAELADPPPGIRLPGELSISGWLIAEWVAKGAR